VTSRDKKKVEQAKKLGADIILDTESDWDSQLENETVDLVIDSVGAETFKRSLEVLKHDVRMVVFGATTDDTVNLNLREFFYGQYHLIGSTMGSRQELKAMLEHIKIYSIHPVVDKVFKLSEANEAFKYL